MQLVTGKRFYFANMKIILLFALLALTSCSNLGQNTRPAAKEYYMLIGTYTSGKSEGIYVYKFNTEDGTFMPVSVAKGIKNPSFIAVSPDERHVYSVSEGDGKGSVTAFSFNNGTLTTLNSQSSGGQGPCYVATDKTGKWVATGNYGSGSFAVLPIQNDGSLGAPIVTINHEGKSVNANRQEKPHVHATVFSPDNRQLLVPDLGTDKIMLYSFNEKNGTLAAPQPAFAASQPGAGPRHIDFHPSGKYVYLMEELTGTVSVFSYDENGKMNVVQNISSHPADYKGTIGSADIHVSPDGKFLYASNRGDANTIAIFSIDEKSGKLSSAGYQSTLGKTPRNFNFDPSGNYLLVANQNSDNIVIFKRDKKSGVLSPLQNQIEVGNPVCIKWIAVK
jgi:6-phosphogluconolactonase